MWAVGRASVVAMDRQSMLPTRRPAGGLAATSSSSAASRVTVLGRGVTIFGGRSELVGPHCSGAGAMPTLEWTCRRKTGTPRGHESGDNPSWRRNMATPELDQDIHSNCRVAMPPGTLPRRLATPAPCPQRSLRAYSRVARDGVPAGRLHRPLLCVPPPVQMKLESRSASRTLLRGMR